MKSSFFFLQKTIATCLLGTLLGAVALIGQEVAADVVKRGEALSTAKVQTVESCVQNSEQLNGQSVKVEGLVKTVCQKKGCWFVLEGQNGEQIRITSMGYKFFVPKDSSGMKAVIEGKFELKEIAAKLAQHYENDRVEGTKEKPKKVMEPVNEYSIAATAVELNG